MIRIKVVGDFWPERPELARKIEQLQAADTGVPSAPAYRNDPTLDYFLARGLIPPGDGPEGLILSLTSPFHELHTFQTKAAPARQRDKATRAAARVPVTAGWLHRLLSSRRTGIKSLWELGRQFCPLPGHLCWFSPDEILWALGLSTLRSACCPSLPIPRGCCLSCVP